ncbi:hypothetical protein [Antarctobacter sp.]|uniref:hypothetical protein n=1 Tax=Antarctobacter sp. TaxID=1872577 RepID=UPI002B26CD9B|nr:hypothetical protein [Antarctobacter sp.]
MANNRKTLKDIKGDTPWTDAEERVIAEAPDGHVVLGMDRPEEEGAAPEVRAELIRHIVLGGCKELRLPERSIAVMGARITGLLDLDGIDTPRALRLFCCRFDQRPNLSDAKLGGVYLPGCALPGLNAQRLRCDKNLFLDKRFHSKGTVDLKGARISGQLACVGGRFETPDGIALNGNALQVGAGALLRDGFHALGTVNLTGAQITGQLDCTGGRFETPDGMALNGDAMQVGADVFLRDGFHATGKVNLMHSRVAGSLTAEAGRFEGGFHAEGLHVGAALYWRGLKGFSGPLDLDDAHLGRLCDDAESWQGVKPLHISGLRYERLDSGMSIGERLRWLSRKAERRIDPAFGDLVEEQGGKRHVPPPFIRGAYKKQCDPQPYTQLAKVLRAQGVTQGAARVLEMRDKRVRRASYHRAMAQQDGTWRAGWAGQMAAVMRPVDWLFEYVFGYGHKPGRALYWVAGLWLLTTALYAQVWAVDQMAPESAIVLTSSGWIDAVHAYEADTAGPLPLALWKGHAASQDYETFNAALYALDVFIPLDALGQESAWAPSPVRGGWGTFGFYAKPALQIAGWLITAVGAAALTGLVGRKD